VVSKKEGKQRLSSLILYISRVNTTAALVRVVKRVLGVYYTSNPHWYYVVANAENTPDRIFLSRLLDL